MANQIKTSIVINATPQKVWNILMDFEKYSEWNSFILKISGKQKEGEYLNVQMEGMRFKPKVIKIICGKEFRWLGHLLFKGIFDGEHIFKITKNTNDYYYY